MFGDDFPTYSADGGIAFDHRGSNRDMHMSSIDNDFADHSDSRDSPHSPADYPPSNPNASPFVRRHHHENEPVPVHIHSFLPAPPMSQKLMAATDSGPNTPAKQGKSPTPPPLEGAVPYRGENRMETMSPDPRPIGRKLHSENEPLRKQGSFSQEHTPTITQETVYRREGKPRGPRLVTPERSRLPSPSPKDNLPIVPSTPEPESIQDAQDDKQVPHTTIHQA
jgi:hypothetical protein